MNPKHPTQLDLLAYQTGDMAAGKRAAIADHLNGCTTCREALAGLDKQKKDFLAARPFESLDLQPRRARILPLRRPAFTVLALAASVIIGLTAVVQFQPRTDGVRLKGAAAIAIHVRNADGTVSSRDSSVYYPGERIQFTATSADYNYLILMGIDSFGKITTYFPANADSSGRLTPGAGIPLPNSIILDDYIGPELYVAFFSGTPLAVAPTCAGLSDAYRATGGSLASIAFEPGRGTLCRSILITKRQAGRP
jgi:hypothetical protein